MPEPKSEQTAAQPTTGRPGPVFVSGRQHSGNTLVSVIIGRCPECAAHTHENVFFERREPIDKIENSAERIERVIDDLRIDHSDQAAHDRTAEHLREWAAANPEADALAAFNEGMRFSTELTGNTFWLQKATSYIFYAREVLDSVPGSKLIFLMRNPYDISASRKKRSENKGWLNDSFVTTAVAWNRGFRIANRLAEELPDRFLPVRYEDLVTDPEGTMQRVFEFLGIPFDPAYLDVPHINPAENQFTGKDVAAVSRESLEKKPGEQEKRGGINRSRLYYYKDRLNAWEIALVDMLIDSSLVERYYPELPHTLGKHSIGAKFVACCNLAVAPLRIAKTLLRARKMRGFSIGWFVARIKRRIFAKG